MARFKITGLLSMLLLAVAMQGQAPSSGTYAVGTCKPTLPSYATISAALAAVPPPVTVQVCPGTYPEQVVITQPVTLEGITSGGSGEIIVTVPSGGLTFSTTGAGGDFAAQLWVNNVTGTVNVSDITFDATGSLIQLVSVAGIYYENSSGTVKHVTTRNQADGFGDGVGITVEGGASNPTVTIENSQFYNFDGSGIWLETDGAISSQLNATVKLNSVTGGNGSSSLTGFAIAVDVGSTATVTDNWVTGAFDGIFSLGDGTISSNVLVGNYNGIYSESGATVSSNKIVSSKVSGIVLHSSTGAIRSNTIMGGDAGIDFECTSNASVGSNTINNVGVALSFIPDSTATTNSYYNVGTIRSSVGCP